MKHEIRYLKDLAGVAADQEWFRLLPMGAVEIKGEAPAKFDHESGQLILEAFRAAGHDMVIDYEHQTLSGGEAPAAGWISAIQIRPDGLWVRRNWTDKARGYIEAKEYKYFSPVLLIRKKDRKVVGLHNVALTNQPRMNGVPALAAKDAISTEGNSMLEKLIALLGLAEDATEEDVMAAVEDMVAKLADAPAEGEAPVAAKEILDALALKEDADVKAVIAKIKAHQVSDNVVKPMAQELTALRGEIADMKANGLIGEALKDGKISPDEAKKWGRELARTNPEQFGLIVLSRPRGHVVPVDGLGVKNDNAHGKDAQADDEAVAIVAKQMGVSMDDIKTYGAVAAE